MRRRLRIAEAELKEVTRIFGRKYLRLTITIPALTDHSSIIVFIPFSTFLRAEAPILCEGSLQGLRWPPLLIEN